MAFGRIILFISNMIYSYRKTIPDKELKRAKDMNP